MGSGDERKNPLLAVDAIIRCDHRIVLIERKNPPVGWALPGGFVEINETVEDAVRREIREETNLRLNNLKQWRVFSDPERDPRQHVASVVFTATATGTPEAASDAAGVGTVSLHEELPDLVFDHEAIIERFQRDQFKPKRYRTTES